MRVYSAIKSVTLPQETILTSLSGAIKASDADALQGYTVKKKRKKKTKTTCTCKNGRDLQ